jgi:hypothetical protein
VSLFVDGLFLLLFLNGNLFSKKTEKCYLCGTAEVLQKLKK